MIITRQLTVRLSPGPFPRYYIDGIDMSATGEDLLDSLGALLDSPNEFVLTLTTLVPLAPHLHMRVRGTDEAGFLYVPEMVHCETPADMIEQVYLCDDGLESVFHGVIPAVFNVTWKL